MKNILTEKELIEKIQLSKEILDRELENNLTRILEYQRLDKELIEKAIDLSDNFSNLSLIIKGQKLDEELVERILNRIDNLGMNYNLSNKLRLSIIVVQKLTMEYVMSNKRLINGFLPRDIISFNDWYWGLIPSLKRKRLEESVERGYIDELKPDYFITSVTILNNNWNKPWMLPKMLVGISMFDHLKPVHRLYFPSVELKLKISTDTKNCSYITPGDDVELIGVVLTRKRETMKPLLM